MESDPLPVIAGGPRIWNVNGSSNHGSLFCPPDTGFSEKEKPKGDWEVDVSFHALAIDSGP